MTTTETLDQATKKAADAMAKLTVEAMKAGYSYPEAYKAARAYMVGRWAYLADIIPATI